MSTFVSMYSAVHPRAVARQPSCGHCTSAATDSVAHHWPHASSESFSSTLATTRHAASSREPVHILTRKARFDQLYVSWVGSSSPAPT